MGNGLRQHRIDKEWELLEKLAGLNPAQVYVQNRTITGTCDVFRLSLERSPALEKLDEGEKVVIRQATTLRFSYGRFFPDTPIECYAEQPIFHPNVKVETGFVCLWAAGNPRESIIQAVARAQAIMAYRIVNLSAPHVMNREAADWYGSIAGSRVVPFDGEELRVFDVRSGSLVWLDPGRRHAVGGGVQKFGPRTQRLSAE